MSFILEKLKLPRKLDEIPNDLRGLASRTFYFASDVYDFLKIIKDDSIELRELIEALQESGGGGGGGSVSFAAPVGLTVGGGNVAGSSTDSARAEHRHAITRGTPVGLTHGGSNAAGASGDFADAAHTHALAAFGSTAGTVCEGNDSRLIATADYLPIWMPDAQPASPHADDDECGGSSISGSWNVWDVAGYQTRTAQPTRKCYEITATGGAGLRWGGLYKAIPASEFQLVAKVTFETAAPTSVAAGIFVGNLTVPSTGPIHTAFVTHGANVSGLTASRFTYAAYNGGSSQGTSGVSNYAQYLRLRVSGTSVSTDCSPDGINWRQIETNGTITTGFTPAHVGFCFHVGAATTATGRYHFARFASGAGTSAFNFRIPGRLVRAPFA